MKKIIISLFFILLLNSCDKYQNYGVGNLEDLPKPCKALIACSFLNKDNKDKSYCTPLVAVCIDSFKKEMNYDDKISSFLACTKEQNDYKPCLILLKK